MYVIRLRARDSLLCRARRADGFRINGRTRSSTRINQRETPPPRRQYVRARRAVVNRFFGRTLSGGPKTSRASRRQTRQTVRTDRLKRFFSRLFMTSPSSGPSLIFNATVFFCQTLHGRNKYAYYDERGPPTRPPENI